MYPDSIPTRSTRDNRCYNCDRGVANGRVLCVRCWAKVPRRLKIEIWRARSPGDLNLAIEAAREAIKSWKGPSNEAKRKTRSINSLAGESGNEDSRSNEPIR